MRNGIGAKARTGVAVLVLVGLGACTTQYRNHGFVPPEDELQQIVPGVDTRASVEELIGVPTTSGVRNEGGYYYISSQVKHFAWQRPEVVDRTVVEISFTDAGVVENITTYGLEDGRVVPLTRRITRTRDGDISFVRKLFGNIGALNLSGLGG
ncbi:outer membrane protein assembly factor BamE [Tropicibacter oceani]|uniref:Outer membrane protein assembly factor BamE n=1 Tax=Tropicibacter oceani TaxID=3058420 RepID=A0ABY8QDQ0_9RHOB|nr:outer membrane protein assembly factor BamE [Tropicibacter oceani]WGW02759.1 outer membrane protein assembly factor BamE [Tropicibacter oceani]